MRLHLSGDLNESEEVTWRELTVPGGIAFQEEQISRTKCPESILGCLRTQQGQKGGKVEISNPLPATLKSQKLPPRSFSKDWHHTSSGNKPWSWTIHGYLVSAFACRNVSLWLPNVAPGPNEMSVANFITYWPQDTWIRNWELITENEVRDIMRSDQVKACKPQ